MAEILKARRLINPGKKRNSRTKVRIKNMAKRLSLRQKLFFGSKKQRAAAKQALGRKRNPGNRKRSNGSHRKRSSNVGEIITIRPLTSMASKLFNPGRKHRKTRKVNSTSNSMAKKSHRRRRNYGTRIGRSWSTYKASGSRKRKKNPGTRRHRRRTNPGMTRTRTRTVVKYRYRNPRKRRSVRAGRRRNPGFLSGGMSAKVGGFFAGAFLTTTITSMLPSQLTSGIIGYATTALVAMLQGKAIGKLLRNPTLGNFAQFGGYSIVALKVMADYVPGVANALPFSLRGMGIIGPSSFYTPQVPLNGNFGQFVTPAAVVAAIPAPANAMAGLNQRRGARVR